MLQILATHGYFSAIHRPGLGIIKKIMPFKTLVMYNLQPKGNVQIKGVTTMASCPKCGRQVNDKIHVPLSEIGPGLRSTRCTCGQEILYKHAQYDEWEQKRQEEQRKRSDEEFYKKHTDEGFTKGFNRFFVCYIFSVLGSSIFLLIVKIINDSMWTGILWFICSFAILVVLGMIMCATTLYAKGAEEAHIRRKRLRTYKFRAIGIVLGVAMFVLNIIVGLNGGQF